MKKWMIIIVMLIFVGIVLFVFIFFSYKIVSYQDF